MLLCNCVTLLLTSLASLSLQEFCQALKSDPKIFRNYFKVSNFNKLLTESWINMYLSFLPKLAKTRKACQITHTSGACLVKGSFNSLLTPLISQSLKMMRFLLNKICEADQIYVQTNNCLPLSVMIMLKTRHR